MNQARTLFEKLWNAHVVTPESADRPAILYIDLHLLHEVTSPQAFARLRANGIPLRRTDRTVATLDHSTPTLPATADGKRPYINEAAKAQVAQLELNCREFGVCLHGWDSTERGIVHVIGPELGLTQPGMTVVCGDSHTSTHGAFGALAFGIGTTEVGHVMATQCLLQRKPKTLAIHLDGTLAPGVGAKDLILHIIGQIGVNGGNGHVIEYCGPLIKALSMEQRMTVCNMSIEAGARAGLIAPDDTTFRWLKNRPHAPQGAAWKKAVESWRKLKTDTGAHHDRTLYINANQIKPTVTYGTHPGTAIALDAPVPAPTNVMEQRALDYMQSCAGKPMQGTKVDMVFLGSCTNARLTDLREAAAILRGQRIADSVHMLVVPGSEAVRRAAEAEGLHQIFRASGATWRVPGCSMCIGMNGDLAACGQLVVSTSNRNFEGRQGKGVRTVLASPMTAAASAIAGTIADPRPYMEGVANLNTPAENF